MAPLKKYRLYCTTEATYTYVWGYVAPTVCPNNSSHTVNSSTLCIVDSAPTVNGVEGCIGTLTSNTGTITSQLSLGGTLLFGTVAAFSCDQGTNTALVLQTNSIERLRVSANGYVGVNTVTPTSALDINGNARIRSGLTIGSVSLYGSGTSQYSLSLPTSLPAQTSSLLFVDPTGNTQFARPAVSNIYVGATLTNSLAIHNFKGVTAGGTVTYYPTSDGTSAGTALFTEICTVQASAVRNSASASAVPFCGVRSISADLKTVIVNVVTGTGVIIGGITMANAPDNLTVFCLIVGKQ